MQTSLFDRGKLSIEPLANRRHNLDIKAIRALDEAAHIEIDDKVRTVASRIVSAKAAGGAVILMMGAHVLRSGVQHYLIDLMERGYITCIATNGAGMIHDFEFAMVGATTESVGRYINTGQFGLWKETAQLNDIINAAYERDKRIGMGRAVGEYVEESGFAFKSVSILAAGSRLGIPVTIHVGIGYDIIHEHPNCDGAATGALSYNDFLRFASVVENLQNGVVMNLGSAVMAPEVFLKALSMARNAARSQNRRISRFTTVVCDLVDLPDDISREPAKGDPNYFYRPFKTMLIRAVSDGGQGFYIKRNHSETVPALWTAINRLERKGGQGS